MPHMRERIALFWHRLTTPRDALNLQCSRRTPIAILLLFPAGSLPLFNPNPYVLALAGCMWLTLLVALYYSLQGRLWAAKYWCFGGIHLAFYGLSFMSSIGLTGGMALYGNVLFILSIVGCTVILPSQKHVYYVLLVNYLSYACFLIFARNPSMLASSLFYGWSYVGLLLFLLLYSTSKTRNNAIMRESRALSEMLYHKERADRLARLLRAIERRE